MSVILQLQALTKQKRLIFFDECSFKRDCKPSNAWQLRGKNEPRAIIPYVLPLTLMDLLLFK